LFGSEYDIMFIESGRIDLRWPVAPHAEYVIDMVDTAFRAVDKDNTVFMVPSAFIAPNSLQVPRGIRAAGTTVGAWDMVHPDDEYYCRSG
jgi:hypothetical protein